MSDWRDKIKDAFTHVIPLLSLDDLCSYITREEITIDKDVLRGLFKYINVHVRSRVEGDKLGILVLELLGKASKTDALTALFGQLLARSQKIECNKVFLK